MDAERSNCRDWLGTIWRDGRHCTVGSMAKRRKTSAKIRRAKCGLPESTTFSIPLNVGPMQPHGELRNLNWQLGRCITCAAKITGYRRQPRSIAQLASIGMTPNQSMRIFLHELPVKAFEAHWLCGGRAGFEPAVGLHLRLISSAATNASFQ